MQPGCFSWKEPPAAAEHPHGSVPCQGRVVMKQSPLKSYKQKSISDIDFFRAHPFKNVLLSPSWILLFPGPPEHFK